MTIEEEETNQICLHQISLQLHEKKKKITHKHTHKRGYSADSKSKREEINISKKQTKQNNTVLNKYRGLIHGFQREF